MLGALALVRLNALMYAQAAAAEYQRFQLVNRMPLVIAAAAVVVGFGLGLTLPPRHGGCAWTGGADLQLLPLASDADGIFEV